MQSFSASNEQLAGAFADNLVCAKGAGDGFRIAALQAELRDSERHRE